MKYKKDRNEQSNMKENTGMEEQTMMTTEKEQDTSVTAGEEIAEKKGKAGKEKKAKKVDI